MPSFGSLVLLVVGAFGVFGAKGAKAMFRNVLIILAFMASGLVIGVVLEAIGDWDGASWRLPTLAGILGAIVCISNNRHRRAALKASATNAASGAQDTPAKAS
jgi:hypothetical protein